MAFLIVDFEQAFANSIWSASKPLLEIVAKFRF